MKRISLMTLNICEIYDVSYILTVYNQSSYLASVTQKYCENLNVIYMLINFNYK